MQTTPLKNISFKGDVTDAYFKTNPGNKLLNPQNYKKLGDTTLTIEDSFGNFKKGDTVKAALWETNHNSAGILVIGNGKRELGRCKFFNCHDKIEVDNVINAEDQNIKGVGAAFFQYLSELSLKFKKQIHLTAFNENENPIPFYNKIGFVAESDNVQKRIEKDLKNDGYTEIENVEMKSCPKLYEHFKDKITKTPFIKESAEKLNEFLKKGF